MTRIFWTILAFVLAASACKKSDTAPPVQENSGCIERLILPSDAHAIAAADAAVVNDLFDRNGIDRSRFRYYQYTHDTFQTLYPPFTRYDQKAVRLDQYANGIRVFTGRSIFVFWDNVLHHSSDKKVSGIALDTKPRLSPAQVRWLFMDDVIRFDKHRMTLQDSCLKAEFGYYDLNAGTGNKTPDFVKAWRVTVRDHREPIEFPYAYYKDDGTRIFYDDGIRTSR